MLTCPVAAAICRWSSRSFGGMPPTIPLLPMAQISATSALSPVAASSLLRRAILSFDIREINAANGRVLPRPSRKCAPSRGVDSS